MPFCCIVYFCDNPYSLNAESNNYLYKKVKKSRFFVFFPKGLSGGGGQRLSDICLVIS